MKPKKVEKKHIHKWKKDYNDCPKCGGCEQRWCEKDGCYEVQFREGNGKWEKNYF